MPAGRCIDRVDTLWVLNIFDKLPKLRRRIAWKPCKVCVFPESCEKINFRTCTAIRAAAWPWRIPRHRRRLVRLNEALPQTSFSKAVHNRSWEMASRHAKAPRIGYGNGRARNRRMDARRGICGKKASRLGTSLGKYGWPLYQ
jgi:hypothetical protein